MPLTPTDVANKQFRIAFRGYSLDEVDAFLDEVENELTRLLRDNADARRAGPTGVQPVVGGAATALPQQAGAAPATTRESSPRESSSRPATADQADLTGVTVPPPTPARPREFEGTEAALRTLLLAQRTADEAIAEAQAEAAQLLDSARENSERQLVEANKEAETTLTSAREEAGSTLTAAREEAETLVSGAKAEAQATLSSAREKAARIDEDVAARIQAATGDLDAQRIDLEQRVEKLRAFEREYRIRLKAYLENQLRDLDSRTAPDDRSTGVPASARVAALAGGGAASAPGSSDAPPSRPQPGPSGSGGPRLMVPASPEGGAAPVGPFTAVPPAVPPGAGTPQAEPRPGR